MPQNKLELPEYGLKSSPETSHFTKNKWISRKNQNKLYLLHLIDILNDLLLAQMKTQKINPEEENTLIAIFCLMD